MSLVTNGFFSSPLLSQIHRKSPKFTQNREFFTKDRGKDGICCAISESGRVGSKGKMEEYNTSMKRMMRNPYEYHHDLGMNYTIINEKLIVGCQPQKPEDIDHLKHEEDVAYLLRLQQDKDIEYWGIDFPAIMKRCKEVGIRHMRRPLNTAYVTLTSKRPCGPNKKAIRGATYDLAKNDAWKEPFESLPNHAFGDFADRERKLIQDRVRGLRGS